MMQKTLILFLLFLVPGMSEASSEVGGLDDVYIDLDDKASLQRGARTFVNYCLSCHGAAYMRYNRMGSDLGISDELVRENLLFAADRVGDLMTTSMSPEQARAWFGIAPPDLSLVARSRGPNWVYTYLRSFYADEKTATGWNNTLFPNVAMPHVLYSWQGSQRPLFDNDELEGFEIVKPGQMSAVEYDTAMRDLTNFLVYLAEPAKLVRYDIGIWVLLFLVIFGALAYLLKKEYWKDVH